MVPPMAIQIASAGKNPSAFIPQGPAEMRRDNIQVKVDQVGIVGAVSLGVADPVGIMTGITGCLQIPDVLVMVIERFIVQDTRPAVAAVTQFIGRR
jgi:hypothetical protein